MRCLRVQGHCAPSSSAGHSPQRSHSLPPDPLYFNRTPPVTTPQTCPEPASGTDTYEARHRPQRRCCLPTHTLSPAMAGLRWLLRCCRPSSVGASALVRFDPAGILEFLQRRCCMVAERLDVVVIASRLRREVPRRAWRLLCTLLHRRWPAGL